MRTGKKGDTGGFTLTELIVTLALITVLAAGAAGSLAAYQRFSVRKQNNEYARTLYGAAQSALTHARASGMLDELARSVSRNQNTPEVSAAPDNDFHGDRQVWYVMKDRGADTGLLFELLSPYVEEDILVGLAICMEADFQEGLVYGISCSGQADRFSSDGSCGTDISARTEERDFGYYGVE